MVSTRDARRRINLAQSLAEPIMQALAHVARRSQAREPDHRIRSGGLAPWQLRRAKDMFLADLRKNLSLQFVASACRVGKSALRIRGWCEGNQANGRLEGYFLGRSERAIEWPVGRVPADIFETRRDTDTVGSGLPWFVWGESPSRFAVIDIDPATNRMVDLRPDGDVMQQLRPIQRPWERKLERLVAPNSRR